MVNLDLSRNPLKIAVFGTGSIGTQHLSALQKIPGIEPIAVPKRVERVQQILGQGYQAVSSLNEVLQMGARVGIIATDTGKHLADGLAALDSGLHILVEKPLSTNALEGMKICLAAKRANRKLFVGCLLRFSRSLNEFRKRLIYLGKIHCVQIECQSYLPDWRAERGYRDSYSSRSIEGGVLRDLIHEIDYAGWIFGWPQSLQARLSNLGRLEIEAEESADIFWVTREGCTVSLRLDFITRQPRRRMRAFGEKGCLEWDGIQNILTFEKCHSNTETVRIPQTNEEMLVAQAERFISVIIKGQDPQFLTDGEEGVKALAVCDAARIASNSRKEESVVYS